MCKIQFRTTRIHYSSSCLIRFIQPKKEMNFTDVTSCYLSYQSKQENSENFKQRTNFVLKQYPNKFFVRMLKYV